MELEVVPLMASDKRLVSPINKSLPLFAVGLGLICCISFALEAQSMERKNSDHQQTEAQSVNASDGISKEEAIVIAQNYAVDKKLDGIAEISRPKVEDSSLVDNSWLVQFPAKWKVRLEQGLNWAEIHIDKKTGEIKSSGWDIP